MQKTAHSSNVQGFAGRRRGHGVKARSGKLRQAAARSAQPEQRIAVNEIGYRIGTSHPLCRIPDWAIEQIHELRESGLSYGAIAAKFDDPGEGFTVSKSMAYQVCQGLKRAQVIARVKVVKGVKL